MSTLTRFVTRQGKRIEVETLPPDVPPSKARRREANLFIKMPLKWAATATTAIGSRQCFVLIWLLHLAWKTKAMTFKLSNAPLASYGVSRETKRRALVKLETAGLIKVERLHGRATIVTLLNT
jgi:hypothetical protein